MRQALLGFALLCLAASASAQSTPHDNPEMAAIFAADQAARSGGRVDALELIRQDAERRHQTRTLFEHGALTTGSDFEAAALVFQHGSKPEDHLLAHVFAVRALALGRTEAEWIAAASLDRYLQASGKSQIYGTQYNYAPETGTTMEPYDRTLLTDALRVAAGTHTVAEQEAQLDEMDARMRSLIAQPPDP